MAPEKRRSGANSVVVPMTWDERKARTRETMAELRAMPWNEGWLKPARPDRAAGEVSLGSLGIESPDLPPPDAS